MSHKNIAWLFATITVAFSLSACTQSTNGQSVPEPSRSSAIFEPEATTAIPGTTIAPPGSPRYLTRDTICALLSDTDLSSLNLRPTGEPGELGGDERCRWAAGGAGGILGVIYRPEDGIMELSEVPGFTYTDITVGRRTGIRGAQISEDQCSIDLAITETSSLGINGTGGPGRGCELVDRAAPIIQANLP